MSEIRSIRVSATRPSAIGSALRQCVFWVLLVGAIGLSKVWFGGSWVIDVIALFLALAGVFVIGARLSGRDADLTKAEIAAWVAAGQPDDVKAWKERTRG